ncbi:MAG: hypothetical protein IT267_09405 [Saprospiraceae bacterium]|nr:hypothetical protein [Saprospiraceae bacterium]
MKAVLYSILLLIFLIFIKCSEDFQLTEPYKDVPVIYGFIKDADTAQYIRVEKLFVDENVSAVELAKNPDSIYYKNAVVKFINLTTNKTFNLHKVNMVDEGYIRDTGNFATSPNYMYKIKTVDFKYTPGDRIMLTVNRGDGSADVTSTIKLISSFGFTSPPDDFRELEILPASVTGYSWKKTNDVGIYNFEMNILLNEKDKSTNKLISKKLNWKLGKDLTGSIQSFKTDEFYLFLKENLEEDIKYEREITGIELIVLAAGLELKSFNDIRNANLGITASQEIPRYTNLSEGFGLFTHIHELKKFFFLGPKTRKALSENEFTRLLGFI